MNKTSPGAQAILSAIALNGSGCGSGKKKKMVKKNGRYEVMVENANPYHDKIGRFATAKTGQPPKLGGKRDVTGAASVPMTADESGIARALGMDKMSKSELEKEIKSVATLAMAPIKGGPGETMQRQKRDYFSSAHSAGTKLYAKKFGMPTVRKDVHFGKDSIDVRMLKPRSSQSSQLIKDYTKKFKAAQKDGDVLAAAAYKSRINALLNNSSASTNFVEEDLNEPSAKAEGYSKVAKTRTGHARAAMMHRRASVHHFAQCKLCGRDKTKHSEHLQKAIAHTKSARMHSMEAGFMQNSNPNRHPAGSSKGGEFAPGKGSSGSKSTVRYRGSSEDKDKHIVTVEFIGSGGFKKRNSIVAYGVGSARAVKRAKHMYEKSGYKVLGTKYEGAKKDFAHMLDKNHPSYLPKK